MVGVHGPARRRTVEPTRTTGVVSPPLRGISESCALFMVRYIHGLIRKGGTACPLSEAQSTALHPDIK